MTGSARANAPDNTWVAQPCCPAWNPVPASYADSDGSGKVNQADVFAIGLNYNKTHTLAKESLTYQRLAKGEAPTKLILEPWGTGQTNDPFYIAVKIENAVDLLGFSFEMLATEGGEFVIFDSLQTTDFIGNDLIAYQAIDNSLHMVSIGQTRKLANGGVNDDGVTNRIYYHLMPNAPTDIKNDFELQNVTGNDSNGNPVDFIIEDIKPVELTSFIASATDKGIKLGWTTASEINNLGFGIERRQADVHNDWRQIGFVNGNGTTTTQHEYSYVDESVVSGTWEYRLKDMSTDGEVGYSSAVRVSINLVTTWQLEQNYPNPFNPQTTIRFALPAESQTTLTIYDLQGKLINTLVNELEPAGQYDITWDATDMSGNRVPSGIYFYRLTAGEFSESRRMILLR